MSNITSPSSFLPTSLGQIPVLYLLIKFANSSSLGNLYSSPKFSSSTKVLYVVTSAPIIPSKLLVSSPKYKSAWSLNAWYDCPYLPCVIPSTTLSSILDDLPFHSDGIIVTPLLLLLLSASSCAIAIRNSLDNDIILDSLCLNLLIFDNSKSCLLFAAVCCKFSNLFIRLINSCNLIGSSGRPPN